MELMVLVHTIMACCIIRDVLQYLLLMTPFVRYYGIRSKVQKSKKVAL